MLPAVLGERQVVAQPSGIGIGRTDGEEHLFGSFVIPALCRDAAALESRIGARQHLQSGSGFLCFTEVVVRAGKRADRLWPLGDERKNLAQQLGRCFVDTKVFRDQSQEQDRPGVIGMGCQNRFQVLAGLRQLSQLPVTRREVSAGNKILRVQRQRFLEIYGRLLQLIFARQERAQTRGIRRIIRCPFHRLPELCLFALCFRRLRLSRGHGLRCGMSSDFRRLEKTCIRENQPSE